MRVLIWNIRVFGRRGRQNQLRDYLRLNKVDILFLQETIRRDFSLGELDSLEVGDNFFWTWLPANDHSGALLAGFRDSVFDVGSVSKGEFLLTAQVCLKASRFLFEFVGVYGPADRGRSPTFLLELDSAISRSPFLVFVAGDFNLIRGRAAKNNNNIDWQRVHQFNDCIACLQLSEVVRSGARYTWSNKQRNPVRCVLDGVLVSPTWETSFLLMSLLAESSIGSDHSPLLFSTGEEAPPRSNRFFF
jgi:endonuclease/exonuclease/phosphatase family metal-dependent hydrolase